MSTKFYTGEYLARVTGWGMTKARTGTPQFMMKFEPVGKINPNEPDGALLPCPNYERTIFRAITKNTADWVADDLEWLGYDKPSFRFLDPDVEGAHNFMDQEIRVRCDHEEYEGVTREKWSFARQGSIEHTPLESSDVRQLDSLFGKKLKERSKASPAPIAANADQPPPNDEIPF